jgi:alpha-tubulin suppressor-like RCC1 family protein
VKCYGDPLTHPRLRPPAGIKSKQVACAHDGCCVLQPPEAGARLRCWSDKAPFFPPMDIVRAIDPLQIGVGYNHDCVLNTDHSVRCWGQAATKFTPPAGLKAKSIAVAAFFTCAVTMDDSVVCWGINPPAPPEGLKAKLVAATFHGVDTLEMAAGANETRHACAIKLDDTVTCWGDNVGGNTEVPATLGPVRDIAVATFNSCAVQLDGTPVCWGTKLYSEDAARKHPMPPNLKLKAIRAKMASYCGLQLDDTLVCWGDSKTGHVNIPAGTKIYVP